MMDQIRLVFKKISSIFPNQQVNFEGQYDSEWIMKQWRKKVMTVFMVIVVIISIPAAIFSSSNVVGQRFGGVFTALFVIGEFLMIALAVFHKINYRFRVIVLLLVCYAVAIVNLFLTGIRGMGPAYVIAITIIALICSENVPA
jgi:hypothetical protein